MCLGAIKLLIRPVNKPTQGHTLESQMGKKLWERDMHYIHQLIQGFATTYDILIFFPYLTFWNDSTKSHQSPPILDCVIELSKVPMDEIVVNASKAPLNVLRKVKKKTKTFRDVLQASRVWIYVTLSRILYYYLLKALHRRYIRFLSLEVQNLC